MFRAQLVIHEGARAIFRRSLEYAKGLGHLRGRRMRAALDTTHILGRGAQEDTYNLIAEGIRILSRELAKSQAVSWEGWLGGHELARYAEPSIKGAAPVDWDDSASREAFLGGLIADGQRLLELAGEARSALEAESEADRRLAQAAELLSKLLWQDVEPGERGWRIKAGTARNRIPSAHDPQQRHGHKSHGQSFTGHKVEIAVDPESQLIAAAQVIAGNASDGESAAALVAESEANSGLAVEQVVGDTAYGSMAVREELGERELIAPTVKGAGGAPGRLTKADFVIDVEAGLVRCPMGEETRNWRWVFVRPGAGQAKVRVKRFAFAQEACRGCARRGECSNDKRARGRLITLHPQEAQLQTARAFEQTQYFKQQYRHRVVVEHRIARLVRLGMHQARYFGRAKTLLQLLLAATVANLTLIAGKLSLAISGAGGGASSVPFPAPPRAASSLLDALADLLRRHLPPAGAIVDRRQLPPRPLPLFLNPVKSPAFRPGF